MMKAQRTAAAIVNDYLAAFYSGDHENARALVTDDFSFGGPFVRTAGRDSFFASAAPLARITRGHRLLRQWEDGRDVCSVFDLELQTPAGTGSVTMTEWHSVVDGQIASARVIFDTAEFRALVPAR